MADRRMGRLVRFDGLRGLLALYVTAGHLVPFLPLPPLAMRLAQAFVSHGLAAVDLFFALSGLVIVQSLARFGGDRRRFLAARARRLLPVYLVVLAGAALLMLAAGSPYAAMNWIAPNAPARAIWPSGPPRHPVLEILAHLLFVHGALPHAVLPDAPFALLGPAWSLSTEWQFYAVIAIFACGFDGGDRALVRLSLAFVALAVLARLYACCLPMPWRFSRAFLPNQAAYFALGIAAARFWRGGAGERAGRFFVILLIVAMALGATHGAGWGRVAKALPPLGWAVAVAAERLPSSRPLRPLARVLGARPILWLGLVSYPLYLVNEPLGRALALLLGPRLAGDPALFSLCWGGGDARRFDSSRRGIALRRRARPAGPAAAHHPAGCGAGSRGGVGAAPSCRIQPSEPMAAHLRHVGCQASCSVSQDLQIQAPLPPLRRSCRSASPVSFAARAVRASRASLSGWPGLIAASRAAAAARSSGAFTPASHASPRSGCGAIRHPRFSTRLARHVWPAFSRA